MSKKYTVFEEIPDLYQIIPLTPFRRTANVSFDMAPIEAMPRISAIDRVIHQSYAISPGPVGEVERPWYMHTHQDDNLIVLHGTRYVDLYTVKHGKVEKFVVTPERIDKDGSVLYEGPAMLVWPRGVFHRIRSNEMGSASINFAVHYDGFDIKTNFNIYDLDTYSGKFKIIREGFMDQKAVS